MRLVDADALKEKAFGKRCGLLHTSDIDAAPTVDAVPVVRCRNCRFSQRINDWVYECYVWNDDRMLNQYCDMGERKDGDSNG